MSIDLEIVDLTEIVGDIETPCDFADERYRPLTKPHDDPARWVMWTKDHGCGVHIRLACDNCKEARLMNAMAVRCGICDHIVFDAADAYSRIEAL